ncbi:MAG: hypothetical protein ACLQF0_14150 [Dissulfurispiraceae bacterium]
MLTEHQRRSLSITFRTIEQHLRSLEQLLRTDNYTGILCEWVNDVSLSQRDILLEKIPQAMEQIQAVAEQFSLDKDGRHARQYLSSELSYCWEILQSVKAKRLQVGEVDEGFENTLDPQIDILLGLLREMQSLLRNARKRET